MPGSKQKLRSQNLQVLKDNCSIAYYNLKNGTLIELSVKERGGKKK